MRPFPAIAADVPLAVPGDAACTVDVLVAIF